MEGVLSSGGLLEVPGTNGASLGYTRLDRMLRIVPATAAAGAGGGTGAPVQQTATVLTETNGHTSCVQARQVGGQWCMRRPTTSRASQALGTNLKQLCGCSMWVSYAEA